MGAPPYAFFVGWGFSRWNNRKRRGCPVVVSEFFAETGNFDLLAISRGYAQNVSMSAKALHEKAGRSQEICCSSDKFFLPPSSHCRHASIRTLEERIVSLGAHWAFSFQPVLPSVWRPLVSLKRETWPRP